MAISDKFFAGKTGNGVRIAIIDSGVNATHPHVGIVAGGIAIDTDGREHDDYVDRLGHGTAVTAVIREKAPAAELFAVKIFDRSLSTKIETLVHAIEWATRRGIPLVNLSLGTNKPEHERVLSEAVQRAATKGTWIVAAGEQGGVRWLPGSLPGVVSVLLDWECPRNAYRAHVADDNRVSYRASGYPRDIPGVPPERNLKGISFAVANMTGFLARVLEAHPHARLDDLLRLLPAIQTVEGGQPF